MWRTEGICKDVISKMSSRIRREKQRRCMKQVLSSFLSFEHLAVLRTLTEVSH